MTFFHHELITHAGDMTPRVKTLSFFRLTVKTTEEERDSPLCRVTWVNSTRYKGCGAYFDNPHLEIGSMKTKSVHILLSRKNRETTMVGFQDAL